MNLGVLAGAEELDGPMHGPVIGQRQGRLPQPFGFGDQMLDAPQPVEQRVFGVGVQVDKFAGHEHSPPPLARPRKGRCVRGSTLKDGRWAVLIAGVLPPIVAGFWYALRIVAKRWRRVMAQSDGAESTRPLYQRARGSLYSGHGAGNLKNVVARRIKRNGARSIALVSCCSCCCFSLRFLRVLCALCGLQLCSFAVFSCSAPAWQPGRAGCAPAHPPARTAGPGCGYRPPGRRL